MREPQRTTNLSSIWLAFSVMFCVPMFLQFVVMLGVSLLDSQQQYSFHSRNLDWLFLILEVIVGALGCLLLPIHIGLRLAAMPFWGTLLTMILMMLALTAGCLMTGNCL